MLMVPACWFSATEATMAAIDALARGSGALLACSGPGAARTIRTAELTGLGLLALSAAFVGIAGLWLFRRGRKARAGTLVAPLVVHPGWWMSATRGDCGASLVVGSFAATILIGLAVGLAIAWPRRRHDASARRQWPVVGAIIGAIVAVVLTFLLLGSGISGVDPLVLAAVAMVGMPAAGYFLAADRQCRLAPNGAPQRPRMRLRTLLLLPIAVTPALLVLLPILPYEESVSTTTPFRFMVVDGETGLPVAGATVQVIDTRYDQADTEMQGRRVETGADGGAEYFIYANIYGRRGLLGETETITYNPQLIRVEAEGYRRFVTSLDARPSMSTAELTDAPLGLTFPPPPSATILLTRKAQTGGKRPGLPR